MLSDVEQNFLPKGCIEFINSYERQCKWVRLSIEHFIKMLRNEEYYFDVKKVNKCLKLCSLMKHYKGEFAGTFFQPIPFQVFLISAVFGFKYKKNKKRVIKQFYVSIARKNGKSFFLAALALIHFILDKESGPEIYVAATKESQAKLLWNDICKIIKGSPAFKKHFKQLVSELHCLPNNGICRALGSDSTRQDGLNCSFAIIDEYHAHPTSGMLNILESSQGARSQPLVGIITTSGFNLQSPCKQFEDYNKEVLKGTFNNDEIFAMIFQLDEEDDWKDFNCYYKSNPGLGIFKNIDQLLKEQKLAIQFRSKQKDFLTKSLNIWINDKSEWLSQNDFVKLTRPISDVALLGKKAWLGVDMSISDDLTAIVLLFPPQEGIADYYVKPIFYIPASSAAEKELTDRVPYSEWESDGWVNFTDTPTINQNDILNKILELCTTYDILSVRFDKYQFTLIANKLEEERVKTFAQGMKPIDFSCCIKLFEDLFKNKKIYFDGNPCLVWNLGNCKIKEGDSTLVRLTKEKRNEKIDGIIALCIAVGGILEEQTSTKDNTDAIIDSILAINN